MNLAAAIIEEFEEGESAEAIALRAVLPSMWADQPPEETEMPYCSLFFVGTTRIREGKGNTFRLELTNVQFDVFSPSAEEVESILEAIDDLYMRSTLTLSNRTHLGTTFIFRTSIQDEDQRNLYHGILELSFLLSKSPQ